MTDISDLMALMPTDYTTADWQYKIISEEIKAFQDKLDNEHEVSIMLTSFGKSVIMNVTDIGYQNPSLMYFYGYVENNYCELIQHISQISFLLMSVKKSDPSKPAHRIGF